MSEPLTEGLHFLGNRDILNLHKTAFLCSRKYPASIVLKSYDWAVRQRDEGRCVISGFHSTIEKDIFGYLIKGTQPVILALARGLKKRWSKEVLDAIESERLLVITLFDVSVKRVVRETAIKRNELMIQLAEEVLIAYASPKGNLENIVQQYKNSNKKIHCFDVVNNEHIMKQGVEPL
jgi:hypothetical protein